MSHEINRTLNDKEIMNPQSSVYGRPSNFTERISSKGKMKMKPEQDGNSSNVQIGEEVPSIRNFSIPKL